MTKEGYPVLGDTGPVRVDPQAGAVSFGPRGEISQGGVVRGQVQLVEVADPAQLQHLSGSYYRLPANLKTTPATGTTVQTGFLEEPTPLQSRKWATCSWLCVISKPTSAPSRWPMSGWADPSRNSELRPNSP